MGKAAPKVKPTAVEKKPSAFVQFLEADPFEGLDALANGTFFDAPKVPTDGVEEVAEEGEDVVEEEVKGKNASRNRPQQTGGSAPPVTVNLGGLFEGFNPFQGKPAGKSKPGVKPKSKPAAPAEEEGEATEGDGDDATE